MPHETLICGRDPTWHLWPFQAFWRFQGGYDSVSIIDRIFGGNPWTLGFHSTSLYQLNQMQPLGQRRLYRVIDGILFLFGPGCQGQDTVHRRSSGRVSGCGDTTRHVWDVWECSSHIFLCNLIPGS